MGWTILSHNPGPVNGKHHRKVLKTDIMNYLIIGPLQECGVNGHHRLEPLARKPCRKRHSVGFCDADIVEAIRELLRKDRKAGAFLHGRTDRNDVLILIRHLGKRLAENITKRYAPVMRLNTSGRGLFSLRYPGIYLKGADAVKNARVFLGKFIALAFLGHHMNE